MVQKKERVRMRLGLFVDGVNRSGPQEHIIAGFVIDV
jgi:hypothetical protein